MLKSIFHDYQSYLSNFSMKYRVFKDFMSNGCQHLKLLVTDLDLNTERNKKNKATSPLKLLMS